MQDPYQDRVNNIFKRINNIQVTKIHLHYKHSAGEERSNKIQLLEKILFEFEQNV